jgi:hypothetical protein
MTTAYFHTYIIVCSNINIFNNTYIAANFNISVQMIGLGCGFLIASFKQPKWFFWGAPRLLCRRRLHYTFMDPQTHLGGFVVS